MGAAQMGSHWVNLGHFEHQKEKKKNNDGMIKDTLNFEVHST